VYNSMLGAARTAQEGANYAPQAALTGAQEAYNRQQTYLGQLQGNQLPYQAMTMPQATVPGSAYMMAGLGSGLMNAGMTGINRLINPSQSINLGQSNIPDSAVSGSNFMQAFNAIK